MKKNVLIAIATLLSTWSWGMIAPQDALGATFRYQTTVTDTRLSENPTSVNGVLYDGTFENFIFDPFAMMFRRFSGLFAVETGTLGEAVSILAVQTTPTDRTSLGEAGIARIEYLAEPQDITSVPGSLVIPPGLSEFDFQFIPAPVAGQPTVVTQNWTVTQVRDPSTVIALSFLGSCLLLSQRKKTTLF